MRVDLLLEALRTAQLLRNQLLRLNARDSTTPVRLPLKTARVAAELQVEALTQLARALTRTDLARGCDELDDLDRWLQQELARSPAYTAEELDALWRFFKGERGRRDDARAT